MSFRSERGQASVELVALLPLLVVVALALWQAAVAGHTMWSAGSAARSAARAGAIGTLDDARAAARRVLPASVSHGMRVRQDDKGGVAVTVRVPSVFGGAAGTWTAHARMAPQR